MYPVIIAHFVHTSGNIQHTLYSTYCTVYIVHDVHAVHTVHTYAHTCRFPCDACLPAVRQQAIDIIVHIIHNMGTVEYTE